MALSGVVNTNTYNSKGRYYQLSWTATQSVANNTSTITWTLSALGNNGSWYAERFVEAVIAGKTVYTKTARVERYNGQIATGSLTLSHNSDGSLSFTASLGAELYTNYNGVPNLTGSGSFTLDTIPRASGISVSTAAVGSNPTFTISKASSSFTHTLKYTFGSLSGTIVSKTTASTYNGWTIPTTFYSELSKSSGAGTITCETYNGSTLVGSKNATFTVLVPDSSKPTLNPVVKDTNSTTIALTGSDSILVRYASTASITTGAAAQNGATLKSQKIVCGNTTINAASGTVQNIETPTITVSATDSRDMSNSKTITASWIPYVRLTCNLDTIQADATGNVNFDVKGAYYVGGFGAATNTLTVQYRYKTSGGSYSNWQTVSASASDNAYTATVSLSGLDYRAKYIFQARAIDKIATISSQEVPAKTTPIFDWGENDFKFNVPVSFQGDMMNDFVIETGTEAMGSNGTWYWRKWQSGRADCYGVRNYGNMGVSTAWGGLYRSEAFSQTLPSGLFNTTPEVIDVVFRNSNYGAWIAKHETSAPSTSSSGSFIVVRPASATLSQAYIGFNIIGRWK